MILVGICGASGSGKTTLADNLKQSLSADVLILSQDSYYKDFSHLSFPEREKINYDAPEIFDHEELYQDLLLLKDGKAIPERAYDFTQHRRADKPTCIPYAPVVLLEGIHIFYDERVRNLMMLKIFMHVDPDVCLLRRIHRDIRERGREIEGISRQYLATVKPMFDQYISGYIRDADIVVTHGGYNPKIVDLISCYLDRETKKEG